MLEVLGLCLAIVKVASFDICILKYRVGTLIEVMPKGCQPGMGGDRVI